MKTTLFAKLAIFQAGTYSLPKASLDPQELTPISRKRQKTVKYLNAEPVSKTHIPFPHS